MLRLCKLLLYSVDSLQHVLVEAPLLVGFHLMIHSVFILADIDQRLLKSAVLIGFVIFTSQGHSYASLQGAKLIYGVVLRVTGYDFVLVGPFTVVNGISAVPAICV